MTDPYGQIVTYRVQLKLLERKHQEALDLLNRVRIDWLLPWSPPVPVPRALLLGFIYRFMNQPARAETCFQQASQLLERALRENPNDASRHALLGQAYAGLGRKEEALREGQRAVELLPESKDASDGPAMTLALAKTEILLGDTDAALALLKRSLATPGGVNIHHLELDPTWDSLRANSRFQEILTSLITPLTTNQKE
jgi:serine/threonine-protein kinase